MKILLETADPGTGMTLEALLAFCGIGSDPDKAPNAVLRIADLPTPSQSDGVRQDVMRQDVIRQDVIRPGEGECAVLLIPRERFPDAAVNADRGGRVFFLPVPILLEEGIRVLGEAVRALDDEAVRSRSDARADENADGIPSDRSPDLPRNEPGTADPMDAVFVSPDGEAVSWRGTTVRLTPREAGYFRILYRRRGVCVSREELSAGEGARSNLTDVYIGYLRRKLRPLFGDGAILSVRGKGYVLRLP